MQFFKAHTWNVKEDEYNPQSSSVQELWAGAILIHGKAPMPSMDFGSWPTVLASHLVPSCWGALKEAKNTSNSSGTLFCVCGSCLSCLVELWVVPWAVLRETGAPGEDNSQLASRAGTQQLQKKNGSWLVWKRSKKKFCSEKENFHFLGEKMKISLRRWNVGWWEWWIGHIWVWDGPELSHPILSSGEFLFLNDETETHTKTLFLPAQTKVSIEEPV